jgi:hypothetical protein
MAGNGLNIPRNGMKRQVRTLRVVLAKSDPGACRTVNAWVMKFKAINFAT